MAQLTREVKIIKPTLTIDTENIKVAAYCRVSTDKDDQINSFMSQVKYYTDYISSQNNFELVDIYADEGVSGICLSKREEQKRLLKDCQMGKVDRILVKSVSRFARNSLECLQMIRQLKECGTSVFFENDNIDTKSMNSEMILYVKSAFAQSEALSGAKRVSTAYRMKMENGEFTTYHAPYGYRLVNSELVIHESEAEVVKRIFEMYLCGKGKSKIAGILNREGAIGKNHFTAQMIYYMLSNEKYIGDSLVQKTYTPLAFPLRNIPNKGELDKFYIHNTHTGIIDREMFLATQRLISERTKPRKEAVKRTFTGKIICECGWAYKYKKQKEKASWVCSHKGLNGFACYGPNIAEEKIKLAFVSMYNKLRNFEKEVLDYALSLMETIREKMILDNGEVRECDIEIAKLCEQNNRYEKYRERKIMDELSFVEQTDKLKARLSQLRKRRSSLLSENENGQMIEELKLLKEILNDSPRAIISFDEELFNNIVEKIKVQRDGSLMFILRGNLNLRENIIWQ